MNQDHEYTNEENENRAEQAEEEIKKLKKKLKKAEREKKKYLEGWQKERAEFANYKKEMQKYIEEARENVKEDTVIQFLGVLDNLQLMTEHTPEDIAKSNWYKGVEQIEKYTQQMLKNLGIEEIEAKKGDEFDPEVHEATEGEGSNIGEIVRKGYKLEGKVIRPAQVKVE